jgi:hypothetical protein
MRSPLRLLAVSVVSSLLAVTLAPAAAPARRPKPTKSSNTLGFGIGALDPLGAAGDLYKPSWEATVRGLYFGKGVSGARTSLFYGNAAGKGGVQDGTAYGIDFDFAVRFGRQASAFYFFVGPGYYWTHFSRVSATAPGGATARVAGNSYSANAGFGFSYKHFFVEASYVNVFASGDDVRFVPVTVGFQF